MSLRKYRDGAQRRLCFENVTNAYDPACFAARSPMMGSLNSWLP